MKLEIPKVLIEEKALQKRIVELGRELSEFYTDRHLTVISVSNGATIFVADLIRQFTIPMQLDSIRAYSYNDTESLGEVKLLSDVKLEVDGRDVLVVDDILDTGRTMRKIVDSLCSRTPASIKTCVLLDKPARRVIDINADYVGFTVPDVFVVGYGLDYNEYYRNLPYVGELAR